jgi:ubiquinone/menaquinone biosynthesis C-methylase UbiE
MLKHAKAQAVTNPHADKAFFVASNASEICFSNSKMDGVLCIGVVCYVRDYMLILSEIHRVLKPGGTAIIQINNIRWPAIYNKFVPLYRYVKSKITSKKYDAIDFDLNHFSWKSFFKDLEASGFRVVGLSYYDFRIPFIDILMPKLSIKLGLLMFEKRSFKLVKPLSHGLLIKCEKIDRD